MPLDNIWIKTSNIGRDFVRGASAYHPSLGIILSGGQGDEVTMTMNAQDFEALAPIPYLSGEHCVAAIDANTIFTTGLDIGDDESFMYYKDTGEWVPLPNMPSGRRFLGCGVVRGGTGQAEVVAVGGFDADDQILNTVEIFSTEDQTWRTGTSRTFDISSETC